MKANSDNESKAESSIEKGDRFRDTSDGRVWKVADPHDDHASEELGMPFAWLSGVDHPESNRWMSISEISAKLDNGGWTEVSR